MTSRERFQAAVEHRQPDRVPIDIGGTSLTGMRPSAQKKLAEVLGFRGEVPRANHGFDERIMRGPERISAVSGTRSIYQAPIRAGCPTPPTSTTGAAAGSCSMASGN